VSKLALEKIRVPPILYIGKGKISEVNRALSELHYSSPLVVCGTHTWTICGQAVSKQLNSPGTCRVFDSTLEEVEKIVQSIKKHKVDVLCAVGGGKIIDTCKYAAYLESVDVISIPTTPSHDGICSPIAVIKLHNNNVSRSLKAKMPSGVICDIDILKSAPLTSIRSGIGDLISNLSAVQDWQLAHEDGFETDYNGFAALLARNPAKNFFELMKGKNILDQELLESLIEGLVLSGIAMEIAGSSRPCSGAEHLFSHALNELYGGIASHGEQVAMGTILVTYLRNQNWRDYADFFSSFGMPVDCKSLGASEEQVINALVYGPKSRPGKYTILDKVKIDSALAEKLVRIIKVA